MPLNQYQTTYNLNRHTTRQSGYQTLSLQALRINNHLYSLFPSTVELWNQIPLSIKCGCNFDTFNIALQSTNLKQEIINYFILYMLSDNKVEEEEEEHEAKEEEKEMILEKICFWREVFLPCHQNV